MKRLLGIVPGLVGAVLLLAAIVLGGFRVAAFLRETETPGAGVPGSGGFAAAGDVTMHYREWGPATGEPVLLVHGTVSWADTWYELAEGLSARGYRVIALDLPPFGYSTRPDNRTYSRSEQARRILAFADALGLGSFVLAGHSFGGGATIEAAFLAPQRIRGLVLLDVAIALADPAGKPPAAVLTRIAPVRELLMSALFTNPLMVGPGLRNFIFDDGIVTDARIAIYRRPLSVEGTTRAVGDWFVTGLYGDESASQSADRDAFRGFRPPALVIWGREDATTPLAQGEEIAALLPKATLHVLDNVDHIPHVEAPRAVTALIGDFVAGLEP